MLPSYYAVIPAEVRYDKRLKANEKLLYGEITCLVSSHGYCWARNSYFADLYNISIRSIQRGLSILQKLEYIKMFIKKTKKGNVRCIEVVTTYCPHNKLIKLKNL